MLQSVDIDGTDRGGRVTGITYASYNGGKSVEADSTAPMEMLGQKVILLELSLILIMEQLILVKMVLSR